MKPIRVTIKEAGDAPRDLQLPRDTDMRTALALITSALDLFSADMSDVEYVHFDVAELPF
jgi:hypothetical protein